MKVLPWICLVFLAATCAFAAEEVAVLDTAKALGGYYKVDAAKKELARMQSEAAARSVVYSLEHDLRKIGLGVSGVPISLADSTQIRFYGDVNDDGAVDTLHYYIGTVVDASDTPNPVDDGDLEGSGENKDIVRFILKGYI